VAVNVTDWPYVDGLVPEDTDDVVVVRAAAFTASPNPTSRTITATVRNLAVE